jgi:fumarate hydratase class II
MSAVAATTRAAGDGYPSAPGWGPATERAIAGFAISGQPMPRDFLLVLALLKQCAAETNRELGLLPAETADAIVAAAQEVVDGLNWDLFPVDIYQTGSGTSTNMNANEVIASLASRLLPAGPRVHPNDDVNKGQSSNDVIPTSMHVAVAVALHRELRPALDELLAVLGEKAAEFRDILKLARTHLQDATPMRLGQEFRGYAGQVERCMALVSQATAALRPVALGGTAVGTGINTHPEFARRTLARMSARLGIEIVETANHFSAQSTLDAVIAAHGCVKTIALSLWKIGSDLRLLGTGPQTGYGEIVLPPSGVESSIMPGKSPPAVIESLMMVVARVLGNDATVSFAQTGSILELNVMMPVAIAALLESVKLLAAATLNFSRRCVAGVRATPRGPDSVERGVMLVTALAPHIGYERAAAIAAEALRNGERIRDIALRHGVRADDLDRILDPYAMTEPGFTRVKPDQSQTVQSKKERKP